MQKITPFLWFNDQAEEAMNYYAKIFKNSKIGSINRYPEGTPGPAGTVMTATIVIENQEFTLLNGGPEFQFNESVSFVIHTADQAETDYYWNALTADGGQPSQCGWLKDKFGLSWQVVPDVLTELIGDPDPAKSQRVVQALMPMTKIDIAQLEQAAGK
jgi:predicted 3-demethylubiquinone-9 3-methyltransferase (glyoxalase superfamily)